ncbi:NAD-dependent epimerase/dehydratase family protein [Pseudaquidulcibacter saccharophilus]|uniref:NAD-dependent epimerase/dehydratase family protein n=1 Tax=Pseudaquidulcibacter saccharophilus TaxID=2831900 RepID=UPI001EFF0122|nr:NAD-dependent epimerase/dehydratase family protein [Pseudaquidulcibacter saccharophilus]
MRYLVTGAAGFLGYYVAKKLAETEENYIYTIDNFCRGANDSDFNKLISKSNVEFIECDLTNQSEVKNKLPDDIDYIIHLAALNGTQNFYERPFEVVRCCTLPTIFLFEKYSNNTQIKRFVYAGTSESYASTVELFNWKIPTSEDVPLSINDVSNARWSYAGSKMHGEIATLMGGKNANIDVSIIRFHNAYGPRMGDKHVIPDFLNRAREGKFELYGYSNTRSFIYVDDAVKATLLVTHSDNCVNQIVNIGGEQEISMLDLANEIMKISNLKGEIQLFDAPEGSVSRRAPDISKLKKLVGYEPDFDLNSGLIPTIDFYLTH